MLDKKSLRKKNVKQALLDMDVPSHEGGGLDAKSLARLPQSSKYGADENEPPAMGDR